MKLSEKQQIFTRNVARLIEHAGCLKIDMTFGETYRTKEQQMLYFEGKTLGLFQGTLKVVQGKRKSKTMNSNHLKRMAVDFNFFINGELTYEWEKIKPLGEYWTTLHPHNRWGGDFNGNGVEDNFIDVPHFEMQDS